MLKDITQYGSRQQEEDPQRKYTQDHQAAIDQMLPEDKLAETLNQQDPFHHYATGRVNLAEELGKVLEQHNPDAARELRAHGRPSWLQKEANMDNASPAMRIYREVQDLKQDLTHHGREDLALSTAVAILQYLYQYIGHHRPSPAGIPRSGDQYLETNRSNLTDQLRHALYQGNPEEYRDTLAQAQQAAQDVEEFQSGRMGPNQFSDKLTAASPELAQEIMQEIRFITHQNQQGCAFHDHPSWTTQTPGPNDARATIFQAAQEATQGMSNQYREQLAIDIACAMTERTRIMTVGSDKALSAVIRAEERITQGITQADVTQYDSGTNLLIQARQMTIDQQAQET